MVYVLGSEQCHTVKLAEFNLHYYYIKVCCVVHIVSVACIALFTIRSPVSCSSIALECKDGKYPSDFQRAARDDPMGMFE